MIDFPKPVLSSTSLPYCKIFCLYLFVIGFTGCQTEPEKGLDQYYPYRSVTELKIADVPKTDYFIGLDKIEIPLLVSASNASGKEVEVSEDAIYFTANGERLDDHYFSTKTEGTYHIVAHLGKIGSDTVTIRALDPSKLSLHLSVDADQQAGFIANGKSTLDFKVALFHNGTAVPLSSQFVLYCNNEVISSSTFTTRRAGEYKFKACGANLVSNEIVIEVLSPAKTLRLSKEKNDANFFGYNISETGFILEGLDANNQPVGLSDDVKLYKGAIEIDKNAKFKTNDLVLVTFKAKGYKTESNDLSIDVKSPVKTLKLTYSKVGNTFWADGVSEVLFSLQAFDFNDKSITPTPDVKLYLGNNVIDFSKKFTTTESGDLKFRARGYNAESEEISVKAVTPVNYKVVRIPVIFHEVNTGALTQAKINDLLNGVSKVFRNQWNHTNGPKDPNAADVSIEVYAAERDPAGNMLAVRGLNRVKSDKENFNTSDAQQINEAGNDAWNYFWNPDQYLNIWVYPNITGDMKGYSWAYYPVVTKQLEGAGFLPGREASPHYTYGVFLNADHVGNVSLLAHEIGHMLALSHVFDGNMGNSGECSNRDPDYCNDTPYYNRKDYLNGVNGNFENRYNRLSCEGVSYPSTNVMDYYYTHENSFTHHQRNRVRHVINYGLWLPTPVNGFFNGRKAQIGYMKKPSDFKYTKPISCFISSLMISVK